MMRLIDIKLPQTEMGIFQDLHDVPTHRKFCARLRKAIAGCHGTIGREYLRRLVRDVEEDQDGLIAWLRERVEFYLRRACPADQEPEAETVASRFALAYAALRLAARYKLLPWSWREMYAAVHDCHEHTCTEGDSLTPAEAAKAAADKAASQRALAAAAKERVARHRKDLVKVGSKVSTSMVEKAPGFVHDGKNGLELQYTWAKFQEFVCDGDDPQAMLDALKACGLLVMHRDGKSTIPRDLPAPFGRKRVVCIRGEIEHL
jgi:hypothetical protein